MAAVELFLSYRPRGTHGPTHGCIASPAPPGYGPAAAALSFDSAGNLYGTTYRAGASENGNVFKLSNTPNGWVYSSLYAFTKGADGGWPSSNVSIDTDGTLYGTTRFGGNTEGACAPNGCRVVWMIKL